MSLNRSMKENLNPDVHYVRPEELEPFHRMANLPHLKRVDVVMCEPTDFELKNWKSLFTVPDAWMRRIYKNEIYHDSDDPRETTERLSYWQLKLLNDYVNQNRREEERKLKHRIKPRDLPQDSVIHQLRILDKPQLKNHDLDDFRIDGASGHLIQPSSRIVQLAFERMKNLTALQTASLQRLMKDKEYMDSLNKVVRKYLKSS